MVIYVEPCRGYQNFPLPGVLLHTVDRGMLSGHYLLVTTDRGTHRCWAGKIFDDVMSGCPQ